MRYFIVITEVYVDGVYVECLDVPVLYPCVRSVVRRFKRGSVIELDDSYVLTIENDYGVTDQISWSFFNCKGVLPFLKEVNRDYAERMAHTLELYACSYGLHQRVKGRMFGINGLSERGYSELSSMLDESVELFIRCLRSVTELYSTGN